MVDHGRRLRVGADDVERAARSGSIAETASTTRPASRLLGCPATGKRWRSNGPARPARAELAERLLLGREAHGRRLLEEGLQSLRAGELDFGERVVVEVAPHAGEIDNCSNPGCAKAGRIADTRALQDRRRTVGPCSKHDRRCLDPDLLPLASHDHLHAPPCHREAVAERVVEDREVLATTGRIDVSEGGVDPHPRLDVDRLDAEADAAVEIIEVVDPREPERQGGIEAGAMEGPHLVVPVGAHGQPLESTREGGPHGRRAPAVVAGEQGPAVVVLGAADRDDAPVVRRATADHTCARETRSGRARQPARCRTPNRER